MISIAIVIAVVILAFVGIVVANNHARKKYDTEYQSAKEVDQTLTDTIEKANDLMSVTPADTVTDSSTLDTLNQAISTASNDKGVDDIAQGKIFFFQINPAIKAIQQ